MTLVASPEQRARQDIERLLTAAGWVVQDPSSAAIHAARGVAIREFPLAPGFGFADYLLSVYAEAIVGILREEWGQGNELAQKITYRTTGSKPEALINAFRTNYYPRTAGTGTRTT